MRIPSFLNFINEKKIGEFVEKFKVEIDVATTSHAEERKVRHGEDDPITNDEILETVDKAIDIISKHQVFGDHKVGRKYWIYDKNNKTLNVIGQVQKNKEEVAFVVITVMREENFRGSSDVFKIEV